MWPFSRKSAQPPSEVRTGGVKPTLDSGVYALAAEHRSQIIESSVIPISPSNLDVAWGLGPTRSGVQINERTAMTYTALYACVKVISEAMSMLPMKTYEGDEDSADHKLVPKHELYGKLRREPNPEMSAASFKEAVQTNILLWGNGYIRILMGGNGKVAGLYPVPSDKMKPERFAGKLRYVGIDSGDKFAPEEIIHIPALGYNGVEGLSPISLMREAVSLGKAAELFGATFFGNGSHMGGTMEYPGKLTKEQKGTYRQSIMEMHSGVGNAHRVLVLDGGAKYTPHGVPPDDAQFLETRVFQVRDIARMYRVPPHMVGDIEKAGYNSLEQMSLEFLIYSLMPWLTKWEQEFTRKLFGVDSGFFVKFDAKQLLRADHSAKQSYLNSARQWGVITQNEAREMEDLPPVDGGDTFLQPLNMQSIGEDGKPVNAPTSQPPPNVPPGDQNSERFIKAMALRSVFEDAFNRMLRKETNALRRNNGKTSTPAWQDRFYSEHERDVRESLMPASRALCKVMDRDIAETRISELLEESCALRHAPDIDVMQTASHHAESLMEDLINSCKKG